MSINHDFFDDDIDDLSSQRRPDKGVGFISSIKERINDYRVQNDIVKFFEDLPSDCENEEIAVRYRQYTTYGSCEMRNVSSRSDSSLPPIEPISVLGLDLPVMVFDGDFQVDDEDAPKESTGTEIMVHIGGNADQASTLSRILNAVKYPFVYSYESASTGVSNGYTWISNRVYLGYVKVFRRNSYTVL